MGVGVNFYLVDMQKYKTKLLPAYRTFFERAESDPLKSVLKEAIAIADGSEANRPGFVDFPAAVYEEFVSILDGEQFYSRAGDAPTFENQKSSKEDMQFFVKSLLAPTLFALVCVRRTKDLNPWQKMYGPELTAYLYSHSRWIEERLTFSTELHGELPEIVIGEWSRFMTDDEVETLDRELSRMPLPATVAVAQEFNNLLAMCHEAAHGESARILACIL